MGNRKYSTWLIATFAALVVGQDAARDPGVLGPALEEVFVYNDQWPSGITVSSTGRLFSNFPLDADYTNTKYQVAELHPNNNTQIPYPSAQINQPPGGAVDNSTYPATSKGLADYLIAVQSVVVDAKDRLWILDSGRVLISNNTQLLAKYGGPKLIGVDLRNNSIFRTILFPPTVAYADSYLNDFRVDLRPSLTASGGGVAYIADSSAEGRNGIVVVDLGSGDSWRHLDGIPEVRPDSGFYVSVWGESVYTNTGTSSQPITPFSSGSDGITLSNDGDYLYFCAGSSQYLYRVPTARLRDRSASSELTAAASVNNLGQKGVSDALESDSNGIVYGGSIGANSIITYNPANGSISTYVRDPRLGWTDSLFAANGSLYFTENQVWRLPAFQGGIDRRVKPYILYRVPLIGNGTAINLQ